MDSSRDRKKANTSSLFSALYNELRRIARREVRRSGAQDLLGTDSLVHEAWLAINRSETRSFAGEEQFLIYAKRTMRGVSIDHVRAQHAQKRGAGVIPDALDTEHVDQNAQGHFVLAIAEALADLAAIEPELARVIDLKFFSGLTLAEIAGARGVSERTVQRHLRRAQLLLYRMLT
jgi:RNA polymerase sigma factor (TIGR02999 family)